jgi:hypothetical protein
MACVQVGEKEVEAATMATMEAQILASTVQIELFDNGWVDGEEKHTRVSTGLGTVVQYGGRRYILTHNHWSISAAQLNRVEIRNGVGELLLVLPEATFYTLVRYQDGGTMVLDAPEGLAAVTPAGLGDSTDVQAGNTVWMATYANDERNRIKIETAGVEEVEAASVPGRFWLQGDKGAVIVGDSGGGVWVDGKLVGNLWGIYLEQKEWIGIELFDVPDQIEPTGLILAGLQPLTSLTGVTAEDMSQDLSIQGDYERGIQE